MYNIFFVLYFQNLTKCNVNFNFSYFGFKKLLKFKKWYCLEYLSLLWNPDSGTIAYKQNVVIYDSLQARVSGLRLLSVDN